MKLEFLEELITDSVINTSEDFKDKIWLVYNDDEFYIHDGKETLVMLKGQVGDYFITHEHIISSLKGTGTHTVAVSDTMDIALDAYNQWLNYYNQYHKS
jgi:hypothetical protein